MDVSLLEDSSALEASSAAGSDAFMSHPKFGNKSLDPMVPAKVRTMREYEQQLGELRKENFQLKLRLFYIQQGKGGQQTGSIGASFEAFRKQAQRDMETLVSEIDKRNALIQKNWVTIKQQHEAIEDLSEEKLAIEKELVTLKTKMCLAEAAHKDDNKMADVVSELEKRNEQLEQDVKALRQRLGELEEREVPDLRSQVDKRNFVIQTLTTQLRNQEKTVRSLESQVSLLSSAQPLTDTFLERLDKSLANSDMDSALAAKDQFKADFVAIASKKKSTLDSSATSPGAMSTLKERMSSLEAEVQAKEAVIEDLNREVSELKTSLRSSKDRCCDLEAEIRKSAQVHARICSKKDKLLESLHNRVQELEESVQESQVMKSRYSALERECSALRAAICEKSDFIKELLAEREKATLETEMSFHGLIRSMKQKDEHIEQLRAQLKGSEGQESLVAGQHSTCNVLLPECTKFDVGKEAQESKSFDLIELSATEGALSPGEDDGERSASKCSLNDGGLLENLSELYKILCEVGEDIDDLRGCSTEQGSDVVKKLMSALKCVSEKGYCLVPKAEKLVCLSSGVGSQSGDAEKCDANRLEPILSEKLSEICAVLSADAESSTGWRLGDLVSHLDLFLSKVKGNDSELSVEKEMALVKENKTLRGHLQTLMTAIVRVRSSEREMRTELSDFRDGVLGDLAPLMECVGFLREEIDMLSLSTKEKPPVDNRSSSVDELVFAFNGSGRLVPFTGSAGSAAVSPEPGLFKEPLGTKDVAQQTEAHVESYSVEQLKNELNKSQAQVRFLQKSLKDSFSVKMSEGSRPLIEIDQNRPAPEGSPNKSGNRRWRRQLTNQKMSEFGLSENVFELQEEIFFLVLRIEDLERQLGCGASTTAHDRSEKSLAALMLEPRIKALQSRNGALEQQLQEMQEVSAVLLCRLEELATFLEHLLVSDGSGAPGSVSLPPDTVARMRQLVADSRDISLSVSQSILGGSDTGSVLSDRSALRASVQKELPPVPSSDQPKSTQSHLSGSTNTTARRRRKIDPKDIPAQHEDIVFLEDEVSRLSQQVEQQQAEIEELTRRLSENPGDPMSSGRSKRSSVRSQSQKLEKLLRRMQGCSSKLEDALAAHKKLCVTILDAMDPETAKEAVGQAQIPPSGLVEMHVQTMRKLQFKLEEMVINSELLREILTEKVESGSVARTELLSTSASSPEAETAQKLQQCCKELECKERREEILKRAIAHEQAAKLQIEKELLECQKELQALREVQEWNLGSESRKSLPSADEVERLKTELKGRIRETNEVKHALEKLGREVTQLQNDKLALVQKLEATHKEHETLLESSSNKIAELVTKLGPLSAQNKNLVEELRSLKEVNMKLQTELDSLHRELEAFDLLQKENEDLRDSIQASKNEEMSLRDKLQCIVQEFQLLRRTMEEYCRNELVLKEENESLSTKVLKLTTQVEELEADAEELKNELERSEKERRTALEQGRETERMAEQMQRDLEATRIQLEEMKDRCTRLEQELSTSNETRQQLASTNRDLQRYLESKTEQLRAMEVSNRDLQQTLFQRGKESGPDWKQTMVLQEFEEQKRRLQGELLELRHQVERARQDDRQDVHCHNQMRNSPVTQGPTHITVPDFPAARRGNKSPTRASGELGANASSLQESNRSRSHHASPDLGIDSDPTPEREDESAVIGGGYEEHWKHRMGGNWSATSIQSAPDAMGGSCPLCTHNGGSDTTGRNRLNWTFAGEAVDYPLEDCSPSKSIFPVACPALSTNNVRLCAIVQLVDHELLKKRVDESICLVRRLEGNVQQLLDVLLRLVPEFDEAPDSKQLLQEALSGCHSIKVCLVESFKLICSFTISPMQDTKDECRQRCCFENKQLKEELSSLQEKLAQQGAELQSALEQISTFKEKKEGMERAISRQLSKTKMVLKQTKGNLNVLRNRDAKADKK